MLENEQLKNGKLCCGNWKLEIELGNAMRENERKGTWKLALWKLDAGNWDLDSWKVKNIQMKTCAVEIGNWNL